QYPIKLCQRFFVKGHIIQFIRLQTCLGQAISDRLAWKARIMLHAAKSLFLSRRNDFAVNYQRRRTVVIEGRDAENRGHLARTAGASPCAHPCSDRSRSLPRWK